jgi:predicted PurR-regulated permease PerM
MKHLSHKYALLIAVGIVVVFLLKFITPLAFAALVAYLAWPLHKKLSKKTSNTISALILTLSILVLFGFLLFSGFNFILNESANAYTYLSKIDFEQILPGEDGFATDVKDATRFIFTNLISYLSDLLKEIPTLVLNFFVFIGTLFYLITDGEKLVKWIKKNIPWDEKGIFLKEVKTYTDAFVKVWLIVAILQGIATSVGFLIFKLPYPILAGFVSAILSFLPFVGPYFVYIPVSAVAIGAGSIGTGIGILIYGLVIGSILDYIVRPHFAGKWSRIHPLIILIGIISGISLLGPSGLIAGPIILFSSILMIKTSIKGHKIK